MADERKPRVPRPLAEHWSKAGPDRWVEALFAHPTSTEPDEQDEVVLTLWGRERVPRGLLADYPHLLGIGEIEHSARDVLVADLTGHYENLDFVDDSPESFDVLDDPAVFLLEPDGPRLVLVHPSLAELIASVLGDPSEPGV